ncbi:tRNA-guanine transglycosylase [Candidatus Saccharibacteria bacterium]|nr:tRNA-guanine transglycosylase [Candidatus Saccharibacteria bacterium]
MSFSNDRKDPRAEEFFSFEITARYGDLARAGVIHAPHGSIETPTFTVVGTHAAVKCLTPNDLRAVGVQVMLSNGYHLLRRAVMIDAAGGLAEFNGWRAPTMTDSGGFQIMSLGSGLGKIVSMSEEDGAISSNVFSSSSARSEQSEPDDIPMLDKSSGGPVVRSASSALRANEYDSEKNCSNAPGRARNLTEVDDEGVTFRDPYHGRIVKFTPELSIATQHKIGADVMMAFDELTSFGDDYDYNVESLERTRIWAERSLREHVRQANLRRGKPYQALFGVLQGGRWQDLREKAAHDLAAMRIRGAEFDGFGLGGAFEKERLGETIKWMTRILPENKPRHLLGLSKPDDIFVGVENGCDTFDCVAPTREARHGRIYTLDGDINLRRSEFASDERPLDPECDCPACCPIRHCEEPRATRQSSGLLRGARNDNNYFSRATLRAMLKSSEPDEKARALSLLSRHNVRFIIRLTEQIRASIIDGTFDELKSFWLKRYYGTIKS